MPPSSAPTAVSGGLPGTGGALAAGRPGCQRKAIADLERAEGAGEAPCPRPAGDQGPQEGAAVQGKGHG